MNILEITIQGKTLQGKLDDSYWPVVVEHSQLDVSLPIRREGNFKLSEDDRIQLLSLLGSPQDYGIFLGRALFCDHIRDAFVGAITASEGRLRVLLTVEAEANLGDLRWERLCAPFDGNWNFLARNQQSPLTLYLPSTTTRRFPPIGRRNLQALVLVSCPKGLKKYGLDPFNDEATVASLQSALGRNIHCEVLATVPNSSAPTLSNLMQRLTDSKEPYTLLHIVCHGQVKDGETYLYFATPDNQIERVDGATLVKELKSLPDGKVPYFAFLSTCESAAPDKRGVLGGLAQQLVQDLGMPAVVAMTEKITIRTAEALAERFYQRLRETGEVDLALVEATAGLGDRFDITVPALFSRLGGRPLFSDTLNRPLTNQEIQYGLDRLQDVLKQRAPVLKETFEKHASQLQQSLVVGTEVFSSKNITLEELNKLCGEVLSFDFSFNALAIGKEIPKYDTRCPFRGLTAFRPQDSEFFFGREQLIEKLQQKLKEHPFLPVLGASGSGKSSVVMAGLLPALIPNLIKGKLADFREKVAYLTPGSDPVNRLTIALGKAQNKPEIVVIDQFEELFTLCTDENKRQDFINEMLQLLQRCQGMIILTMRADFWGDCARYRDLKNLMQARQELISPMNAAELRQAIEQQAKKVGLRFEAGLTYSITQAIKDASGAMPLLQHALLELWKRRHGQWLRADEYEKIGGGERALANTADRFYEDLSAVEQEQMQNIFVRLARSNRDVTSGLHQSTRQRVALDELVPAGGDRNLTRSLINRLADKQTRLLVTSIEESSQREMVEVAHEALIRYWPRLQDWLKQDQAVLRLLEMTQQAAQEWNQHDRDFNYLVHRGGRLEDAEELQQGTYRLNEVELAYIQSCVALRNREQQRQRRLTQIAFGTAGIFMTIAGAAGWQWWQTQMQRNQAIDSLITASDELFTAGKQLESLIASLNATKQLKKSVFVDSKRRMQVIAVLRQAVDESRERNRLQGHTGRVDDISFSQDGKILASTSRDQTIKLWDTISGKEIKTLSIEHTAGSISFSLDSKTLTTTDNNGDGTLWDIATGKEIKNLLAKTTEVNSTNLTKEYENCSLDAKICASAQKNGDIKIQDTTTGKEIKTLSGHTGIVGSISLSLDGRTLASGGLDRTIRLWNISTGREIATLLGNTNTFNEIHFNPNGKNFASITKYSDVYHEGESTIRLWNVSTNREITTLQVNHSNIVSIKFSPDGKILASVDGNGVVKVWDTATSKLIKTLSETVVSRHSIHQNCIISFSPDGKTLAFPGEDATIKLWNIVTNREVKTLLGHNDVNSVSFSPDGKTLAFSGEDATIKLWNIATNEVRSLLGHTSRVFSISFSPDGKTLASSSWDKTIKVWDVATGSKTRELLGHRAPVSIVSFSADSKTLASGSEDETTKLWNPATGQEIESFSEFIDADTALISIVSLSTDGKILASGIANKNIKLRDTKTGEEIATLSGHTGAVNSVSFSPDGKILASAGSDGTVVLWNLDLDELRAKGCNQIRGYLQHNPSLSENDRHLCDDVFVPKQ